MTQQPTIATPAKAGHWLNLFRSPAALSLLLALATIAAYSPIARNGFVNYDDSDYVTANAHIQSGFSGENFAWAFRTGHASNWHPLTWLSHMLDWRLFGDWAGGHHLVSLALHVVNTLLLFHLLRRMTGALERSALVAGLFALHPLHVESVAWVSERKDALSAFFFLLTLLAYVKYVKQFGVWSLKFKVSEPGEHHQERSNFGLEDSRLNFFWWYSLALLFFALGLMAKPMLVTVPFVLLLLDYWPLRRLAESGASSSKHTASGSLPAPKVTDHASRFKFHGSSFPLLLIFDKIPFFALSALSSYFTLIVQEKGGAVSKALTLGERICNALVSYARYLGKTFWPENLSVLYPHPGRWPAWQIVASAALLLAIFALVIALAKSRPYLAVGWFWFIGMLIPVIGLVQVGIQSMADRYTYLPHIGLFIALVWGLTDLFARVRQKRRTAVSLSSFIATKSDDGGSRGEGRGLSRHSVLATAEEEAFLFSGSVAPPLLASVVLFVCGLLTFHQVQFWHDSGTLFRHAVSATKRNYLAYNNLGFYLSGQGKTDEAMEDYHMAIRIDPTYADSRNNLGFALAGQKKYAEAIEQYLAALRYSPNNAEIHNNLGNALSESGRIDEAITHYLIALKQKPDHADAHNNLGIALAMKGRLDEAIVHFHDAIRFKRDYASAHSNLGNALAAQHKLDDAIREYQESLRLNPADAQAQNNLGNVLAEQGRLTEAIAHYQKALSLNPNNPEAHFNLGILLLRQGRRDDAVQHFRDALRLRPDYREAIDQLNRLFPAGQTGR